MEISPLEKLQIMKRSIDEDERSDNLHLRNYDPFSSADLVEIQEKIDACGKVLDNLPQAKTYDEMKSTIEQLKEIFSHNDKASKCIDVVEVCLERNLQESEMLNLQKQLIEDLKKICEERKLWFHDLAGNAQGYRTAFYYELSENLNLAAKNKAASNDTDRWHKALIDYERKLKNKDAFGKRQEKQLAEQEKQLKGMETTNTEQQKQLAEQQKQLAEQQKQLAEQQKQLKDMETTNTEQQKQIKDSEKLKKHLNRRMIDLESSFQLKLKDQMDDYDYKFKEQKNDYECKFQEQKNDYECKFQEQKKDYELKLDDHERKIQEVEVKISSIKLKSTIREVTGIIRKNVLKEVSVYLNTKITNMGQIQTIIQSSQESEEDIKNFINDYLLHVYKIDYQTYEELLGMRREINAFIHSGLVINDKDFQRLASSNHPDQELQSLIERYKPAHKIVLQLQTDRAYCKDNHLCYKCFENYNKRHQCQQCLICYDKGHLAQDCPRKKRCDKIRETLTETSP